MREYKRYKGCSSQPTSMPGRVSRYIVPRGCRCSGQASDRRIDCVPVAAIRPILCWPAGGLLLDRPALPVGSERRPHWISCWPRKVTGKRPTQQWEQPWRQGIDEEGCLGVPKPVGCLFKKCGRRRGGIARHVSFRRLPTCRRSVHPWVSRSLDSQSGRSRCIVLDRTQGSIH